MERNAVYYGKVFGRQTIRSATSVATFNTNTWLFLGPNQGGGAAGVQFLVDFAVTVLPFVGTASSTIAALNCTFDT